MAQMRGVGKDYAYRAAACKPGADDNGYQLCFGNPYGHKPCVHGRTVRGIFPYGAAALKSPFLFANA